MLQCFSNLTNVAYSSFEQWRWSGHSVWILDSLMVFCHNNNNRWPRRLYSECMKFIVYLWFWLTYLSMYQFTQRLKYLLVLLLVLVLIILWCSASHSGAAIIEYFSPAGLKIARNIFCKLSLPEVYMKVVSKHRYSNNEL